MTAPTNYDWRYLPHRPVKHALVDPGERIAVCGVGPYSRSADEWHGTGTQTEYETVERLPACKRCVELIGTPVGSSR